MDFFKCFKLHRCPPRPSKNSAPTGSWFSLLLLLFPNVTPSSTSQVGCLSLRLSRGDTCDTSGMGGEARSPCDAAPHPQGPHWEETGRHWVTRTGPREGEDRNSAHGEPPGGRRWALQSPGTYSGTRTRGSLVWCPTAASVRGRRPCAGRVMNGLCLLFQTSPLRPR
ncbi:hypothetical protein HJG60_008147 [Phyllostomus discolor]|uniref:Uncharacterized protein n=1 Tax=Phyllostomus discolor TaxID=89673 RepID=A0A833ZC96_9CHIR|nr:hypothetical protein HJG60_008147 [Phyllostomus discolor]